MPVSVVFGFLFLFNKLHQVEALVEEKEGEIMLTIRVISGDGYEWVKSGIKSVGFTPADMDNHTTPTLTVFYDNEEPETFLHGRVYVMNENGKTVANYEIFPLPLVDDEVRVEVVE